MEHSVLSYCLALSRDTDEHPSGEQIFLRRSAGRMDRAKLEEVELEGKGRGYVAQCDLDKDEVVLNCYPDLTVLYTDPARTRCAQCFEPGMFARSPPLADCRMLDQRTSCALYAAASHCVRSATPSRYSPGTNMNARCS